MSYSIKTALDSLFAKIIGKTKMDAVYEESGGYREISVFHALCKIMNLSWHTTSCASNCIPKTGPLVVVANHPTGIADAILLAQLVFSVRSDVKIISHKWFMQYPRLARHMFFVDPSVNDPQNMKGMLEAIRWVRKGGALIVYPAGDISYLHRKPLKVMDPVWKPEIARLLRMTRPQVLPVFFFGRNSSPFQLLSLCWPKLRKLLIIREFLNKRGRTLKMCIGSVIPYGKLSHIVDDIHIIDYLRNTTHKLKSIAS